MTGSSPGVGVRTASWAGTAVFVVTAVAAAVAPATFETVALAVAATLFAGGCAAFVWAFLVVAGRSRTQQIELAQVWFLAGAPTPRDVRRSLLGAFAVQVVAALAAGVLVPMWGLGLCGAWAARHATFPPRSAETGRRGSGVRSVDADTREQDP